MNDYNPSVLALLSLALREAQFVDRMTEDKVRLSGAAGAILSAMQQTRNDGRGLDQPTLRRLLAGDERALTLLEQAGKEMVPFENYAQHRNAVGEEQLQWAIDSLANRFGSLNTSGEKRDPMAILRDLETEVGMLVERHVVGQETTGVMDTRTALKKMWEEMKAKHSHGISTGVRKLDQLLHGGLRPTQFAVIASRPGIGKSALMCNVAEHMIANHVPVLIISIEMTVGELLPRIVSMRSRLPLAFISSMSGLNALPEEQQKVHLEQTKLLLNQPLFVDETADVTLPYLRGVVRRYVRSHHVRVVFIDYLQLMKTEAKDTRSQELDELSRGLKLLAKELKIVIVALAQLNRDADQRKPRISDLRESGGIEANANLIGLMSEDGNRILFDLAKNRGGPKGEFALEFEGQYMLFRDPIV